MDFAKIKYSKGSMTLEWADEGIVDTKRTTLTSSDEPEKEFVDAMQALAPIVADLLELPKEYVAGLTIIGVSLSYNETQGRGCVVTCLKELAGFNAPLVLNTPHLAEDAEHGPTMPLRLSQALGALCARAGRFKDGHRLQSDMFATA